MKKYIYNLPSRKSQKMNYTGIKKEEEMLRVMQITFSQPRNVKSYANNIFTAKHCFVNQTHNLNFSTALNNSEWRIRLNKSNDRRKVAEVSLDKTWIRGPVSLPSLRPLLSDDIGPSISGTWRGRGIWDVKNEYLVCQEEFHLSPDANVQLKGHDYKAAIFSWSGFECGDSN